MNRVINYLVRAVPALMLLVAASFFFASATPVFAATDCASADVPQAECEALVALYNATDGANWITNTGWLQDNVVCNWYGIQCFNGNVSFVELYSNNLSGSALPAELANLTSLAYLDLGSNNFSGAPLPTALPPSLINLNLYAGGFTGTIPTEWNGTNLPLLEWLALDENSISGEIPASLSTLTSLTYFSASFNDLTGTLPADIGNLSNLTILRLNDNLFDGALPASFGSLTNLIEIDLTGRYTNGQLTTGFTGSLPAGLSNMVNLETLRLGYNRFEGKMPSLASASNLSWLDLPRAFVVQSGCATSGADTGEISTWLSGANHPNMYSMSLNGNCFIGSIPDMTGTPMQYLDISRNPWTFGPIPAWIANAPQMELLTMYEANLNGPLPTFASPSLYQIIAYNNNFTGGIPTSLNGTNHPQLETLSLYNTGLEGPIPGEIGTITTLRSLFLFGNRLTSAPVSLLSLTNIVDSTVYGFPLLRVDANKIDASLVNEPLASFLDAKNGSSWRFDQTIPPSNVTVNGTTSETVSLSWTRRDNTSIFGRYEIGLSETQGGPYTFNHFTTNKSESSLVVDGLTPETTYYMVVRVQTFFRPFYSANVFSENSAEVMATTSADTPTDPTEPPTAPVLVSPVDGQEFNGSAPEVFIWNDNPAAEQVSTYRLTLFDSANTAISNTDIDSSTCNTTCEVDVDALSIVWANGDYSWRVRATNIIGNTNSAQNAFSIEVPGTPVLIAPEDNAVDVYPLPDFEWERIGAADEFRLSVFDGSNTRIFRSSWTSGDTLGCFNASEVCALTYPAAPLTNGTYRWQVEARNETSFPGQISKTARQSFTIAYPYKPDLVSPAPDAVVNDATPILTWQDDKNNDDVEYRVTLINVKTREITYRSAWVESSVCDGSNLCSYEVSVNLPNREFEWFVQVRDPIVGSKKPKSARQNFVVEFPSKPSGINPIGTVENSPSPLIEWNASLGAVEYRVRVRNADKVIVANSGWISDVTAACDADTLCAWMLTTELPSGAYQWSVDARNTAVATNKSKSPWYSFSVSTPGVATDLAPGEGTILDNTTNTFTFTAAPSATQHRIKVQDPVTKVVVFNSGWLNTADICVDSSCSIEIGLSEDSFRWRVEARNNVGTSKTGWSNFQIVQ